MRVPQPPAPWPSPLIPDERAVVGLAHAHTVVRPPTATPTKHRRHPAEGRMGEVAAPAVGRPPAGVRWVHVRERASDIFASMATGVDGGQHVRARAYQNRVLVGDGDEPPMAAAPARNRRDYARRRPPHADGGYRVAVPARTDQPAPPAGAAPVEGILLADLPMTSGAEAHRAVAWYSGRWLVDDHQMGRTTGCRVERRPLDAAADLRRRRGCAAPSAVRWRHLRQCVRRTPALPAKGGVDPLMVDVLARRPGKDAEAMTGAEVGQAVARWGGQQGRRRDGPPGWRTLWQGDRYLSDMTAGARIFAMGVSP